MTDRTVVEEAGFEALQRLYVVALRDTGQSRDVASFLLGLYNRSRFPFNLTDLRGLDSSLFEDCLAVLRMDARVTAREVHTYFADGSRKFEALAKQWNLADMERVWTAAQAAARPEGAPAPLHAGGDFNARVVSYGGHAPGYRDAELVVTLGETQNTQVRLRLSKTETADLLLHLAFVHAAAWRNEKGPIDRDAQELRPLWLDTALARISG